MKKPYKVKAAILISGGGTNLQALIDSCADEKYPVEISVVISNKKDAYGLERGRKANIKTAFVDHKQFSSRKEFDQEINNILLENKIEIVCLAGFMRILSAEFVQSWLGKMINIHPSLLPSFKGANAVEDAFNYGVKITGCTVHFVTVEMDSGPIILQKSVEVAKDDDIESLKEKILAKEHIAYKEALELVALGKVQISS